MDRKLLACFVVVIGVLITAGTAFAHHGTNVSYDPEKSVTLSGTVSKFVWANPHGQLHWDVKDAAGKVTTWGGELHSIALLTRSGWNKNIIKAGDTVTVTGHPSRAGTPFMVVTSVKLGNGKEYFIDLPEQGQEQ
jgi:hypothetical protein